jgi:hypothetical protein
MDLLAAIQRAFSLFLARIRYNEQQHLLLSGEGIATACTTLKIHTQLLIGARRIS